MTNAPARQAAVADAVAHAERALSSGDPLFAYDVCHAALQVDPGDGRLLQLQAIALARSGAQDEATAILTKMIAAGARNERTLGTLARLYKDRWQRAPEKAEAGENLRRALELYSEAYRLGGSPWTGINAATLLLASGEADRSIHLARRLHKECAGADDKWLRATAAEALLLQGDLDAARDMYRRALAAGAATGDRATMRRNARLILRAQGQSDAWLEEVLPSPVVAVFAGHMPDEPARLNARFPVNRIAAVAHAIRERIASEDISIGYASAAAGADILFHEALQALGRTSRVVLPSPPDIFLRTSVAAAGDGWIERFHRVLDSAADVIVQSQSSSGDIGYVHANWTMLGLARLQAKAVDGRLRAMAFWSGEEGSLGGTSSAVADWTGFGEDVHWLSADTLQWRVCEATQGNPGILRRHGQRMIAMLFADAVGFSKLPDEAIPSFVESFLGTVAMVLKQHEAACLTRNTWGDGLYFTFERVEDAALAALRLCEAIAKVDWGARGLPQGLSIRTALHCGPAYEVVDPVTKQVVFIGSHVSRAARIEPVTPPGAVFASQSFAALCECTRASGFACEYVGRVPLAKKFGEYPMYSVRPRPGP